jgi:hypothetical protein
MLISDEEQRMAYRTEALYVVQFGDVAHGGHYRPGGVLVLWANRIFGGSSGYYYLGEYSADEKTLEFSAKIVKHDPAAEDPFGERTAFFNVVGQLAIGAEIMEGQMERPDHPGLPLPLRLIRKEDLP